MDDDLSQRTRLPTEVDDEDPMLMIGEMKFSFRQMLTIAFAVAAWFLVMQLTLMILPISGIFAGILWSWILLVGLFLALKKKDGRPYEEYLSDKIQFLIGEKEYVLKDPRADDVDVGWDQPLTESEANQLYWSNYNKDE